jgi:PAS domain S-box-containing protein
MTVIGNGGDKLMLVGLGASAGGVEALMQFFALMPEDTGMAFVVVLHLSPEHESRLAEVLRARTGMEVEQVRGPVRVAPNCVYVVPPDKNLYMADGQIRLAERGREDGHPAPVDLFFRTLADNYRDRAVAVVLSGSGADGSVGVRRIKEEGGVAIAQEPGEAEHAQMPRAAIETGAVDFVLPVAAMPERLVSLHRNADRIQLPSPEEPARDADEDALREVLGLLRARTRHDFSDSFVDITARKAAEERLRESEEQFRRAIEDAPIPVIMHAEDGEVIQISRTWTELTGYTLEDAPTFDAWLTRAYGEGADAVRDHVHELFRGRRRTLDIEFPVRTREGGLRHWSFSASSPGTLRDGRRFIVGMAVDITERRQAEEIAAADLQDTQILQELSARLVSEENVQTIYDEVLTAAIRITRADAGTVEIFDSEAEELVLLATSGFEPKVTDYFHRVNADSSTSCGVALKSGARAFVDFDPNDADEERRLHVEAGYLSAQSTPLVSRSGAAIGMLSTHWRAAKHRPTERELRFLDLLARQAADLIEQRRAEEVVRRSEAKYRALFDSIDEGFCVIEVLFDENEKAVDYRFLQVNPAFERHTGIKNAVGRTMRGIASQHEEYWYEIYGRVALTGEPMRFENKAEQLGFWYDVYAFRIDEPNLRRVGILFNDITERKRSEEALRESEERLQKAMSIETVGVIFFNAEGVIHHANEAFERMSGYSHSEIRLGKLRWEDLTPPEFMEASLRASEELKTKGQSTPYEKQYLRPDTSRWWGLFAGKRLGEGEFVEFVLDVTDRKNAEAALRASEERLRLVVESVEDYAIFTTDAEGRINSWNPGAERMFGYPEEEAVGQNARIIFTPEDQGRGVPEEEMRRAREEGRAPDERWHLSKRGERFYLSGVLAPLRDAGGKLTGYAKIARDLTERKELEEALGRAYDEMEQRVRERTLELAETNVSLQEEVRERRAAEGRVKGLLRQLVTVQEEERRRIARELHDTLGQQLAALRLSIDILKSRAGEDGPREEAERMQAIFDRLNSDVDFLAWELRPAALDMLGLDAALQTFVREWGEHFSIEADYRGSGSDAPRLAPEVETNLYRILQEALQNVHKHAGATHVSVQLERRGGQAVLVVEDNGRGYDPDAEVEAGSNKGMGVTNMRERAALVGGELEIESAPGAGATIYVRVPSGRDDGGGVEG